MASSNTWADLAKRFAREDIYWRPQGGVYSGKVMALAYLDARAVMDRLDDVVGPENWGDSYFETPSGRIICALTVNGVTKSDGAGDTAVEGEKGAISDAFKRAAVKFGIGRYLYSDEDLKKVWVKCETKKAPSGKIAFKEFSEDPWDVVDRKNGVKDTPSLTAEDRTGALTKWARQSYALLNKIDEVGLDEWLADTKNLKELENLSSANEDAYNNINKLIADRKDEFNARK